MSSTTTTTGAILVPTVAVRLTVNAGTGSAYFRALQSGLAGVGYGKYHFKYASGRELDWPLIGLASRKDYISIYICATDGKKYVAEKYKDKLKASIGKSCIRFKKVEDIDWEVLKQVFLESVRVIKKTDS